MTSLTVLFNTYPVAFDCPGGGEVQLLNYKEALEAAGVRVLLYDVWHAREQLDAADIVHYFSVQGGSWRFCGHIRDVRKLPLVLSPIIWIDDPRKYGLDDIGATLRLAHRDFLPRWGYTVRLMNTSDPTRGWVGNLWSASAGAYLPGVWAHHSIRLRAAAQYSDKSVFRQKELFPRGARYDINPERYMALAVDYQLPLWYPDTGINSLLYFRRVRANLALDYARYRSGGGHGAWRNLWSYGLDITLDIVPIRLPASTSTAVTFTIHKPSDRSAPVFGVGFTMPI